MVVGAYLLTKGYDTADWKDKPIAKYYNSISDVERDLYFGYIKIDDKVVLIVNNAKYTLTAGSVLLYKNTGIVVDYVLNKGGVNKLISGILTKYNTDKQIDVLHKLQTLVFETATKYGLTISIEDTKTNPEYVEILSKAKQEADSLPLTDTVEVNGKVIPKRAVIWDNAFNICVDRWFKETSIENNLQLMGKGGARVTEVQIKAMILGKGLQTNMDNSINPNAIIQSLSSGLDPWNYFNTCGSARRSFTSNVAVTPASGYMTRQFITNARDLQITAEDCGTNKTIILPKNLALYHYDSEGKLITKDTIHTYNDFVSVRSPLTCEHTNGLCSKCCGVNLKNGLPWKIGFGIGSSAAHTCSEGVTQATLKMKHLSGSVNLKTYGKQVDDILSDVLSFLGGRSTQLVKLSNSNIPYDIDELEGSSYEEKASNFVQIMQNLFENAGMNYSSIWYEVIGRALSDIVLEGKVPVGYRSKGYKTDEPKFMNLFKANTVSPSWLKSISFGYTKKGLRDGIRHRKSTLNLATEKIIMGKNILDD